MNHLIKITTLILTLIITASTQASVIAIDQSQSSQTLYLLSFSQQSVAHKEVASNHTIVEQTIWDASTLQGVDIIYLLPGLTSIDTPEEIVVITKFVNAGGRLILAGDHGCMIDNFPQISGQFGVEYGSVQTGTCSIDGSPTATVLDYGNPITNGPAGVVNNFGTLFPNGGLISNHPAIEILATYPGGSVALGYRRIWAGDVVFLTDFNSFDNGRLDQFDNHVLWTNLFIHTAPTHPIANKGGAGL